MDLSPCFQKIFSFLAFLSKKRKYVLIETVMYFRQADWLRWCKIIVVWSQCRSPERVKKMLWNSRQVIYRNINVRGDGLISLNFMSVILSFHVLFLLFFPVFFLEIHWKDAFKHSSGSIWYWKFYSWYRKKRCKKPISLFPHWIFQPLFNDIIIPTNSLYFKRKCDFES